METGPAKRPLPDPSKWIAAQKANAQQAKQSKQPDFVYLKTGEFAREERAQEAAKKIRGLGLPAIVKAWPGPAGDMYLTLCGPIVAGGAKAVTEQLKAEGFKGVQKVSVASVQ